MGPMKASYQVSAPDRLPNINGASGVPVKGREFEYATELWLEGPSAFWLHPEGPLSDKTPEEWKAEQRAEKERVMRIEAIAQRDREVVQRMEYVSMMALQQQRANPYVTQINNNYAQNLFGFRLWS